MIFDQSFGIMGCMNGQILSIGRYDHNLRRAVQFVSNIPKTTCMLGEGLLDTENFSTAYAIIPYTITV